MFWSFVLWHHIQVPCFICKCCFSLQLLLNCTCAWPSEWAILAW
jgi:hypothetical protein